MSTAVASPPRIEVSDTSKKETEYEDDFEDFDKELDSFIATKADADNKAADNKQLIEAAEPAAEDSAEGRLNQGSEGLEKGSEEIEKGQKEYKASPGGAGEPEGDEYTFSEHQKRAMMELIAQRQENDFPDEDPPEYDVKDRLVLLNAELAQESAPQEREHKVGFKDDLVDLVAPPPDFTDDEDSQRDSTTPDASQDIVDADQLKFKASEHAVTRSKDQVVLERDGKFEVVNTADLTPDEREMLIMQEPDLILKQDMEEESKKMEKNANNSNTHAKSKQPSPPKQPRPSTATNHTNHRRQQQLRPADTKQRPHSAMNHASSLDTFTYSSPYALTPQQKELARQRSQILDNHKKEEERKKREERQAEQKENEEAFKAWLKQKQEEAQRKKEREEEEKKKNAKEEKDSVDGDADSDYSKDTEAVFKAWLKEKRLQIRREKLLKRRQEQELKDVYHTVSREECDKAFKEWVRKKGLEMKKHLATDKPRSRSARPSGKRTRKSTSLLRAIRNAQSFQHVDYYGYKF